jgi:two-component system, chemotaxis family, sensor kinase CheA
MSEQDPIVVEFVVESREHLSDVENQLLAIEAGGADIDLALVNTVFRAIHSIKGAASFLGFTKLGDLAHSLENALNLVRNRELIPDSTNIDVMLRAADAIHAMFDDIQSSNNSDISAHLAALEKVVTSNGGEVTTFVGPDPLPNTTTETADVTSPSEQDSVSQPIAPEPSPEPAPVTPVTVTPVAQEKPQQAATPPAAETNIRVPVQLLDSLMNLAGELVLSRNQLIQQVSSIQNAGLDAVASRVDQITSELQEAVMQTRMQVVGTVFSKFPRVVRDLSNQLEKKCQLTLEGEDVELDKSIIEGIGDPLTHLVRNSADHGVESPAARIAAGKPETGTIILRAYHQAGKVNISISDDGAGIDATKLKEKAIAKGILTSEQATEMSEREAVRLIFHPGFSMAEKLTGVSGRGVGMDVVKTNIEKLGGTVSVDTQIGVGTTINVKLPLTLAIVPSLIVRCGERRYALPQTNIRELVRIKGKDVATSVESVKNAEVFRLRGALLPLVRLKTALGAETIQENAEKKKEEALNIIVVEAGHLRYGLIVDGLHDSEEIVVKPLGRHMQDCETLTGATILGDGQVALILDVTGIATHCELAMPEDDDSNEHDEARAASNDETQTSLLFTNHPSEQFGIPMESISRLERIRVDQIDSVGGKRILQYRGESLPLLCLEDIIQATPQESCDKVYVVVFSVLKREVGLIVPELIDIRQLPTDVDTVTFIEPGVVGSVEVNSQATRLLDVYEMTKQVHPDWFKEASVVKTDSQSQQPKILLAEDSAFFRRQVTGFLEEAGYDIVGCEDGLIAWNTLQERSDEFDIIVTDIEMPNMDGCQLARRIKENPSLAHFPIVALTSLSSEQDMQRGMEAGIDDYQVKLDRERLIASVARFLRLTRNHAGSHAELATVGS